MSNDNELKPTPCLCGAEAKAVWQDEGYSRNVHTGEMRWWVHCNSRSFCLFSIDPTWRRNTQQLAVEYWNEWIEKYRRPSAKVETPLKRYEPCMNHNTGVGPMPDMMVSKKRKDTENTYYLASEADAVIADLSARLEARVGTLPEGCPTVAWWHPVTGYLHTSFQPQGNTKVEIHPVGTRALLASQEAKGGEGIEGGHWWCPECRQSVTPQNVTFHEYHDTRSGGCGLKVLPGRPVDQGLREATQKASQALLNAADELDSIPNPYTPVGRWAIAKQCREAIATLAALTPLTGKKDET